MTDQDKGVSVVMKAGSTESQVHIGSLVRNVRTGETYTVTSVRVRGAEEQMWDALDEYEQDLRSLARA